MRAARGDAQIPLHARKHAAAPGKDALRHGNRLMAPADHVQNKPLAHKRLILREHGGPGPVHRDHAAAEAPVRGKAAARVIARIEAGQLGAQLLMVFGFIRGKALGRYPGAVARDAPHIAHVHNQLYRENGQKAAKTRGNPSIRLGEGALGPGPQGFLVQARVADNARLPGGGSHNRASFHRCAQISYTNCSLGSSLSTPSFRLRMRGSPVACRMKACPSPALSMSSSGSAPSQVEAIQ